MKPTPIDVLMTLVRVLERAETTRLIERETAARRYLGDLRAQFGREYRAMEAELRCRGSAPSQTEEQYAERRLEEVARWNGWIKPEPSPEGAKGDGT